MNEQTTKLIEQLAQKLGTTAEYLWTALLKQAPISAMIDLVYLVIVTIMGIGLYKLHKYCTKETGEYKESIYEDKGELVIPAMVILAIVWVIFFIVCFFSIGNIINGFFNPEYWALKEVLGACK
jgi:hypothetical protein